MMHGPNGHGTHLDTDGYQDGIEIYDGTDDIHVGLAAHRDESEIRGRAEEGGLSDEEDDDDLLDDDLMDKISSSPSINDDGMVFFPKNLLPRDLGLRASLLSSQCSSDLGWRNYD
jgi:hypothetical protein